MCGFKGGNPYVEMCFPSSKVLQIKEIKSAEFFMIYQFALQVTV